MNTLLALNKKVIFIFWSCLKH